MLVLFKLHCNTCPISICNGHSRGQLRRRRWFKRRRLILVSYGFDYSTTF